MHPQLCRAALDRSLRLLGNSCGLLISTVLGLMTVTSASTANDELLPAADFTLVPIWSVNQEGSVYGLAWSPDSRLLAVAGRDNVWLYRAPEFTKEDVLRSDQGQISALAWSPDAASLAAGGQDGTIWIWTPTQFFKKLDGRSWILALQWSLRGDALISVDQSGFARIWDLSGFARATIQLDGSGLSLDLAPDNSTFAVGTGGEGSSVSVYDLGSATERWRQQEVPASYRPPFGYGKDEVNGVAYSPDGKYLASVRQDGRLVVLSAATGVPVMAVQAHQSGLGGAHGVSWSPGSNWIATSGEDGRVNLIQFPAPQTRLELLDRDKPVWAVAISPDGKWIAAGADDGNVFVWSTPVTKKLAKVKPETKKPARRHRRQAETSRRRRPTGWHFVPRWPFLER